MNSITAIDIVLLPDANTMDEIIAINNKLRDQSSVVTHPLNTKTCFPHISLNMCGIQERDITTVTSHIKHLIQDQTKLSIKGTLQTKPLPDGQTISEFTIESPADTLSTLHEKMLGVTKDIEMPNIPLSAYVQSDDLTEETVQWTANFRNDVAKYGFNPHITLNIGDINTTMELQGTCDRIALCQLGNYCTCRKIISEFPLQ